MIHALLLVLAARSASPTLALPPGTAADGWDQALRLAGLEVAPSSEGADLVCHAVDGGWEIRLGRGGSIAAVLPAPSSQREREDLSLLAASLAADLGLAAEGGTGGGGPNGRVAVAPVPRPVVTTAQVRAPGTARRLPAPEPAPAPSAAPLVVEPAPQPVVEPCSAADPPPEASPPPLVAGTGSPGSAEVSPTARNPALLAWVALGGEAAFRPSVAPGGLGGVAAGALVGGGLLLGVRATVTTSRAMGGIDPSARLAEHRLGLTATWSPVAPRIAPDLGLTLENAWRSYSRGADSVARHTVLVGGVTAGLALRDGPWTLEPTLRLETDLDRTLLRFDAREEALPRLQVSAGFAVRWRSGKKR
jgi:hypothetical protein